MNQAGKLRFLGPIILTALCTACASQPPTNPPAPLAGEPAEEPIQENERYLPRENPIATPNTLSVLTRPTERRGTLTLPGAENTPIVKRQLMSAGIRPAIMSASRASPLSDPIRVHILNIGAGSCQIVECPASDDILIADCGSKGPTESDLDKTQIAAYLDSIGVTGDATVTISHPHEDHYNRIAALTGERTINSVWLGGDLNGYGGDDDNDVEDMISTWLDEQIADGTEIFHGFESGFGNRGVAVNELRCGAAETYILTVNEGSNPNANSLILLVEYGNFRIIFSGDAEGITERGAMANYGALLEDVSVLTSSHHGASSEQSNGDSWAAQTAPQTVIFSSGVLYKHPRRVAGERYLNSVFPDVNAHAMWWNPKFDGTTPTFSTTQSVYATEVSGTVIVESDGNEFSLECDKDGVTSACF